MLGNPERPIGGIAVRMPAGVELRPVGREDLVVAVGLAREARRLPPESDAALLRDRFDALVNSPDTVAFLADGGGTPLGLAVMQLRRRLNFATFEGWMSDLAVRDGDQALAAALIEALVAEWRLRGSHRIVARLDELSPSAPEAIAAAGFERGFVSFRLRPVTAVAAGATPDLIVRQAAEDDFDAVTRLIAEFGPRRSPVPDRMEAVRRTFGAHVREGAAGLSSTHVAVLEGRVVGTIILERHQPFWTSELRGWIPDLVVTEPVRGRGIGRELLRRALEDARGAGMAEVRLESGPQRESAHRMYRSTGFEEVGETWVLRRDD